MVIAPSKPSYTYYVLWVTSGYFMAQFVLGMNPNRATPSAYDLAYCLDLGSGEACLTSTLFFLHYAILYISVI